MNYYYIHFVPHWLSIHGIQRSYLEKVGDNIVKVRNNKLSFTLVNSKTLKLLLSYVLYFPPIIEETMAWWSKRMGNIQVYLSFIHHKNLEIAYM